MRFTTLLLSALLGLRLLSALLGLRITTLLLSALLGLRLLSALLGLRLLAALLRPTLFGLGLLAGFLLGLAVCAFLLAVLLGLGHCALLLAGWLLLTILSLAVIAGVGSVVQCPVRTVQGLLGLRHGALFQTSERLTQPIHLVRGLRVLKLQIVHVFQEPIHLAAQAVGGVVQTVPHLALHLFGVLEILLGGIRQLGRVAGLVEGPLGFVHGPVRLTLHGQNAFRFFTDFATLVFHLSGGFFGRDDTQANFAALAHVRTFRGLEVGRFHGKGDHRSWREAQRGQIPLLAYLILRHHRLTGHGGPERLDDRLPRLARTIRKLILHPYLTDS